MPEILSRLFHYFVNSAFHVKIFFGNVVVFSFQNFCKSVYCVFKFYIFSGVPVKFSATKNGWDKNLWIFLARLTVFLSSSDNSSIPKIAIISCKSLYFCKVFCTSSGNLIMFFTNNFWIQSC